MTYNDAEIIRAGMSLVPDYAAQVQQQLLSDLTRAQIAGVRGEQQIASAKFMAAREREQSYLEAVKSLGTNPTYEGYREIALRFPEHHQALEPLYKNAAERDADRSNSLIAETIGAARNGRWDLAARTAAKMVDADIEAGQGDENDREVLRILEAGTPEERAQIVGILTHRLAAGVGAKNTAEMWNAVFDETRDREVQPDRAREQRAKADTAEAEAETAPDYYGGRAREQVADADVAESNSAWQEAKNALSVAKGGVQLAKARRQIARRGKALGKPVEKVTVGDMNAPTAVNPKTGQRVILRNGKWVKF
ncbi:hypothetical protein [Sphingopyxis sp. QXT-31]|uniref:hypothetical protein n=1 Tax=Sphingopyxis sp. QXT-31 TaxID=1357916 RepID=UPI0012EB21B1|nr:hypothetical protein [Sphingopyxis sp. QXT-31]